MTPIEEQIEFSKQRQKEAVGSNNHDEIIAWKSYLEGLKYAQLYYEPLIKKLGS